MSISSETWFPVVTLLVGFLTALFKDWFSFWQSNKASNLQRKEERVRAILSEQRAHTITSSELAHKFARSLSQCYHQDKLSFRETGLWKQTFLPEELSERFLENQVKLSFSADRLLNGSLRTDLERLGGFYAKYVLTKNENQTASLMNEFASQVQAVDKSLAAEIRKLDVASLQSTGKMIEALGLKVE